MSSHSTCGGGGTGGGTLFLQGDPGLSLCIVKNGRVKLSLTSAEGREIIIDLVGSGGVFGELALLDDEPRSADCVAIEPSELLLLDGPEFVDCLLKRPQLAIDLLAIAGSHRVRRDTMLLQDAAFLDVPARPGADHFTPCRRTQPAGVRPPRRA